MDQPTHGALSSSQRTGLRRHEVEMTKANPINEKKRASADAPKAGYIVFMFCKNFSRLMSEVKFPLICSIFHSVSNPAANGNNPIGLSTKNPGLAEHHKRISSPRVPGTQWQTICTRCQGGQEVIGENYTKSSNCTSEQNSCQ